jgi:actin-related protein 4
VVPTYYGLLPSSESQPKLLFGDNAINTPLPNLEIHNPMSKDGTVEDWDTATKVWEYAITSRLTNNRAGDPRLNGLNDDDEANGHMDDMDDEERPIVENPLLMTETGWNPVRAREKSVEIAMESWGVPAFWLAKNGVLSAYIHTPTTSPTHPANKPADSPPADTPPSSSTSAPQLSPSPQSTTA